MNTEKMCFHASTRTALMPPGSRHWKRLECADCGAFLRFLPKPENYEKRINNQHKLTQLLGYVPGERYELTELEKQFLDRLIILGGRYSPAQQEAFDALCATFGVKGRAQ